MVALLGENSEVEGGLGVEGILFLLIDARLFLPRVRVLGMNSDPSFLALLRHLLLALNLLAVDEVRVVQETLGQALCREERDESKAARLC